MTFLCVFLLFNVNSFASLPNDGETFDAIPDLNGERTSFGKITKVADYAKKAPKVVYESHWASWFQQPNYQDFDDKKYIIYQCEYYFDTPIKDVETERRLAPGESFDFEEEKNYEYEETNHLINENSVKRFANYSSTTSLDIKAPIDILKICMGKNMNFDCGVEWINKSFNEATKKLKFTGGIKEPRHFLNETNDILFVKRCLRQRYYVMLLFEYEFEYETTSFGSGFMGKDRNYKYDFIDYKFISCNSFLLPKDDAYLEDSIYIDKGDKIYTKVTDKTIFA